MLIRVLLRAMTCALLMTACGGTEEPPPAPGPDDPPGDGDPTTPPVTTLRGGLLAESLPYARFEFLVDEPSTFECRLDDGEWAPCTSPFIVSDLEFGQTRVLEVRATNENGLLDETPARQEFTRRAVDFQTLSETGLFADIGAGELGPGLMPIEPTHELWVDGALKRRWVRLPPGTQIDTSNMDSWDYPVGTQFFKEFRTPGGELIETRMIEHRGVNGNDGDRPDLWVGSFAWRADGSDADFAPDGVLDHNGTGFDIPGAFDCYDCHRGQPDWGLGFTAVQLSRPGGSAENVTLSYLAEQGLLSDPPPAGVQYPIPGNNTESTALGFLHSNCSHCHSVLGRAFDFVDMDLMVRTGERTVTGTNLYNTTVGVSLDFWTPPGGSGIENRIQPGNAADSALYFRANTRGNSNQMPPNDSSAFFGSVRVDYTNVVPTGRVQALQTWINSL